jgi:hypothetical protein
MRQTGNAFTRMRMALAMLSLAAAGGMAAGLESADLSGLSLFPADNPWHWDISQLPVHPNSANLVASVGSSASVHPDFGSALGGVPWGIPYVLVGKSQAKIAVNYTDYGDESDPGPYPIPLDAFVEGGNPNSGDRHVLAVDQDAKILYELYVAVPRADHWDAACGAEFNLATNALRTDGWTSADAAGLPILPGLVRYDEIKRGVIDHAIRMTVDVSRKSYVFPARHQAGSTTSQNAPPMGQRYRLKPGFDISSFPPAAQTVLKALKKYGAIVADNGGNWYLSGAPDARYPDEEIDALKKVKGSDFEAVQSVDDAGKPIYPPGIGIVRLAMPGRSAYAGPGYSLLGRRFPAAMAGETAASAPFFRDGMLRIPWAY